MLVSASLKGKENIWKQLSDLKISHELLPLSCIIPFWQPAEQQSSQSWSAATGRRENVRCALWSERSSVWSASCNLGNDRSIGHCTFLQLGWSQRKKPLVFSKRYALLGVFMCLPSFHGFLCAKIRCPANFMTSSCNGPCLMRSVSHLTRLLSGSTKILCSTRCLIKRTVKFHPEI